MNLFNYHPRASHRVNVGDKPLGGDSPLRLQSMTTCATTNTEGCVAQAEAIIRAGGDYIRLTTQGTIEAENLRNIRNELRRRGYDHPLVADVHFNPNVADTAAAIVEKVRINPGNYVDPARTFKQVDYTDEEYAEELRRLEERFKRLLAICREHGTALRIGVNHGSLSDRIMCRYGNTPEGIVESCMEFLRVCVKENFSNVVVSIKASNTAVMVRSVRLLCHTMRHEGMDFPLHLGVTEAGEGEDGRIKSAVGIGALLADGIGDTIRVSLTEAPENEIPVARLLVDHFSHRTGEFSVKHPERYSPTEYRRRSHVAVPVVHDEPTEGFRILEALSENPTAELRAAILNMDSNEPVVVKCRYNEPSLETLAVKAAADLGPLLLDGLADGIRIDAPAFDDAQLREIELMILQAARVRFSHTEYIACPSCGRTLYDIEKTLAEIKSRTSHLKNLRIGVMGCIVNGPGEMADADYGYVGAAPGRITLYKGCEIVERNIPQEEALDRLIDLIKANGDWREAE